MSAKSHRPKISVFIATSIDGYIASNDYGLDWLEKYNSLFDKGEDCGYKEFFSSVDVLIMGKNSYQVVSNFDSWPYEGKRVIVLSSTLTSVCKEAELFSGDITHLIKNLHDEGIKHAYVDGGVTISGFMNAGLIDHMTLSIIPVVLGSGIPLFKDILHESWCSLIASKVYPNGLMQLKYEFVK